MESKCVPYPRVCLATSPNEQTCPQYQCGKWEKKRVRKKEGEKGEVEKERGWEMAPINYYWQRETFDVVNNMLHLK